ncbi:YsnF/AvaK domain-containing protein [Erythrobacteraceae bacterium WH01K]|nr:YsnF/AvaK domain-containing protein [Erythrobacteraceae bacterium WH01K]
MTNPKTPADGRTVKERRIPVIEERIVIDKVVREGDTVSVRTDVVEEEVPIRETLTKKTVDVRRIPKNVVITEMPETRDEGGVTIVPVVEERLVVTKQLVLVEEIHLQRSTTAREVEQTATVRKTIVDIDRRDASLPK